MKLVALLSGGKDSCFNLLHCQRNNHQLVAAATLSPHSGKDEIDSYMYQTVGQDAVALVAQALDVPLYRRVIQGNPVEQTAEYGLKSAGGGGVAGDETEDLYALLASVLEYHPDIQAVSVGAILSNYQRVRVEHVCRRLSLTPLAYLWQRNQTSLLSEMTSSGLEAILIKVAGAGLIPSDLARSLTSVQPKLLSLHQKFGTHPCGEGGEYESFTIDSPLFKSRIAIDAVELVVVDESDVAPVAYLRIKQARLVHKELVPAACPDVPVPSLLEPPFQTLLTHVERSLCRAPSDSASGFGALHLPMLPEVGTSVRQVGSWIAVGNVRLPKSHPCLLSVGDEVTQCFQLLQKLLAKRAPAHSELLSTSATITLLLPELDSVKFSSANAAYVSFFGASPPARACVGVGGTGIVMDCVTWAGPGEPRDKAIVQRIKGETGIRKALHVQSLSYWAPANIGPYSQAISIPPYTFLSGQIGLLPSSLALPSTCSETSTTSSTLPLETALVLQHTARIIRAAPNSRLGDGSEGGFGESDLASQSDTDEVSKAGRGEGGWIQLGIYYLVDLSDLDHVRMNVELVDGLTPTLYAVLSSLPRGARVEKHVLVHSGRFIISEPESSEQEGEEVEKTPEFSLGDRVIQLPECHGAGIRVHYEISSFPPSTEACAAIFIQGSVPTDQDNAPLVQSAAVWLKSIQEFVPFLERTLLAKAFVSNRSSESGKFVISLLEAVFGNEMPALTIIPSHHVASRAGPEWDWGATLTAV